MRGCPTRGDEAHVPRVGGVHSDLEQLHRQHRPVMRLEHHLLCRPHRSEEPVLTECASSIPRMDHSCSITFFSLHWGCTHAVCKCPSSISRRSASHAHLLLRPQRTAMHLGLAAHWKKRFTGKYKKLGGTLGLTSLSGPAGSAALGSHSATLPSAEADSSRSGAPSSRPPSTASWPTAPLCPSTSLAYTWQTRQSARCHLVQSKAEGGAAMHAFDSAYCHHV